MEMPRLIGHRGAAGLAPENTLGGFARAAEEGCSWVELDVQLARDLVPMVVHDPNLQRTTGEDMPVRFLVARRIAEHDAGSWFGREWANERVPTLAQALDTCRILGLGVNVEIKDDGGPPRRLARIAAGVVAERWPADMPPVMISSFHVGALYAARRAAPRLSRALLMWEKPVRLWTWHVRRLRCSAVHVDPSLATERLIGRAHAMGLKVGVYTVNEPGEAEALLARGVDYLFTDRPDRLRDLRT